MEHIFQHIVQPIIAYLRIHPHIGILLAFFVAFSEALPIIGTIIPGSVTMTAIGSLVGSAILPAVPIYIAAVFGALCGDGIGFWLGKHFKDRIHRVWPFSKYPKMLCKGQEFFKRHGGKSILIGRFVGPARSAVPMIAGLLRFTWIRFILVAIPSAMLWALLYLLPGVLLGALALELPAGQVTQFVVVGLIVIVLLWLIYWVLQYFFRQIVAGINRIIEVWWRWLTRHRATHWFVALIMNRQTSRDHHQLTRVIFACICFALFLALFASVMAHSVFVPLNSALFHLLQSLRSPQADHFFTAMTILGAPLVMSAIGALIGVGLLIGRRWWVGVHLLLLVLLTDAAVIFFKHIYYSPRPSGLMTMLPSSSFPSGHTTTSFTVIAFLAILTAQLLPVAKRWLPILIAGLLIVLVSVSRLYLGVHWFTDVLGGWLLGLTIVLLIVVSYRRFSYSNSANFSTFPLWIWCLLLLGAFCLPWGLYSVSTFQKTLSRNKPDSSVILIDQAQWWQHPSVYLPAFRHNRFGRPIAPFNIQVSSSLQKIKWVLGQLGWQIFPKQNDVKETVRRLTSHRPQYHMPLLPILYLNQPPELFMIKRIKQSKSLLELRLWPTRVNFIDVSTPLWIGTIDLHRPSERLLRWRKEYVVSYSVSGVLQVFSKALSAYYESRILSVALPNFKSHRYHLQSLGDVLLLRDRITPEH